MNDLKENNIIVTGATGGIGNSIVKKLYDAGANILATGTKNEKLEELKKKFQNIQTIKFDISPPYILSNLFSFWIFLSSWQKQLQLEQDRTADKIQKNASHFPDESDRATHEEEFTLELRTRERERRLLSKISESIEDLKSDDYGYCASCGIEIGIRRLEARPTATRCIDCKTIEEIHERQQYG